MQGLLDSGELQFIFVGGKGGVGKTTSSCTLSTLWAERTWKLRKLPTLLVSTDPAHNTSDAFDQAFGPTPQPVNGVPHLDCLEIDPAAALSAATDDLKDSAAGSASMDVSEQVVADFKG